MPAPRRLSSGSSPAAEAPLRTPLGAAAAKLLARGYAVVVLGRAKRPLRLPGQEHGVRDATSDLLELEARLFAAGSTAGGLGVACGGPDGPVVVDADGACAVAVVRRLLGPAVATVPHERSTHGEHWFFSPDPSVRRAVRAVAVPGCACQKPCGVDVLGTASHGGWGQFVVTAPTPGRTWA